MKYIFRILLLILSVSSIFAGYYYLWHFYDSPFNKMLQQAASGVMFTIFGAIGILVSIKMIGK